MPSVDILLVNVTNQGKQSHPKWDSRDIPRVTRRYNPREDTNAEKQDPYREGFPDNDTEAVHDHLAGRWLFRYWEEHGALMSSGVPKY